MPPQRKRRTTAEDLYRIQQISGPEISPNGEYIVFSLQRVERKTESKYSNLWIVSTNGGRKRQFTQGNQFDAQPRWSPDGQSIAFLSNRTDRDQSQLYIIPFNGGEAKQLTHMQGKFGNIVWAPDGKRIAYEFQKKDAVSKALDKDTPKAKLGIVYRHITRVNYKIDGIGFLPDERWHIWIISATNGRVKQITHGDIFDEQDPFWSPDGKSIVFKSNRNENPDFNPDAIDLWAISSEGGPLRRVTSSIGRKRNPCVSPDGKWVAYTGKENRSDWWQNESLFVVPFDGLGEIHNITKEFDIDVTNAGISDLGGADTSAPKWSPDSQTIYFQVSLYGNVNLQSISLKQRHLKPVIEGPGVVGTWSMDAAGEQIACFHGDFSDTGQIWTINLHNMRIRKLTRINYNLLRSTVLGEIEEIWFKGEVGNDLQGWVLKPPDFDSTKTYPSILEIHGGPMGQYGNMFMHEFYFLAAHGYIVYFCNPRGGSGYGEAHAKAIWNAAGTADYADLMTWVDYIKNQPYIDPNRMGVTGGSYGGFLVNWIIGHTNRFKAAVTLRSIVNRLSNYGTSDMNWIREETFGDEPPWVNPENYLNQSPLKAIGNAQTPTLVIHSENDMRCPIEQGEQIFIALKRLGVDTEFIRFPDESHGLSRGGRTDRRIARLKHILRWFDKYL